ncbi:hypothetical protein M0R72_02595 [Candidatus Pacearchaeota archaeon]|jgi:hypothetical protein|nr:hypothetical protein [Candidatus Pacearchaeota archaeon]
MARVTQISKEELEPVVQARGKAVEAAQNADKALKDARLAELEFKVQIQQLYLAKNLDANCRVDISNGVIAWPDETAAPTETVVAGEPDQDPPPRVSKRRGKKPAEPETEG